jgi:hypothetical protein
MHPVLRTYAQDVGVRTASQVGLQCNLARKSQGLEACQRLSLLRCQMNLHGATFSSVATATHAGHTSHSPHRLHGHLSLGKMLRIDGLVYEPQEFVLIRLDPLDHLRVLLSDLLQERLQELGPSLHRDIESIVRLAS